MLSRWLGKGYSVQNTRRYPRLPAPWPVQCEPEKGAGRHVTQATDVSAGGVSLEVKETIPVGSRVSLQIHIPPLDRTVRAAGTVVRCLPDRRLPGEFLLGIRFDRISAEEQTLLNDAIERFTGPGRANRSQGRWWRGVS